MTDMIKIKHHKDPVTLTMPQYMLGIHVTCFLNGKYVPEVLDLDKALNRDDRDAAREILNRYGYEIDFFEVEDNEKWNR